MKFTVIAVPGIVPSGSSGNEILKALGGTEGLRSVLRKENPEQLILRFGVDSTCSFIPANNFEDNIPCKLVAKAKLWKSGKCTIEILGPVVDYFSFSHPTDFIHLSFQPVVAGEFVGPKMLGETPSIPPPIFTKVDFVDQLFNKNILTGTATQKIKKYTGGSLFSAVARFEDKELPSFPLNMILHSPGNYTFTNELILDPNLLERLENLFNRRPVWLRTALDEFLPKGYSNWKKRTSFSRICYIFSDGPWRGCMCRLGYDPRKDRNSRFYQTIDFRDPHYRTISWKSGQRTPHKENASSQYPVDRDKTYGEFAKEVVAPNPEIHFLVPPTRPSQLFQLCDICDAGVQNIVQCSDPSSGVLSSECSKSTGKRYNADVNSF
ncbi:conserved hypothetical protein [Theileria orientalis strain Shintoku]|uniref:Transcription factor IIIC subunit 5 HTH domain-containing protein n=1 Tax=Theileria orientalis strain Shintoku TaxID=869250 RepID=J4DNG6_THEOR|nr:conserved hypothetical protein [Theileria orientalis strain Shintoku]PVC53514.1 hypothetical protein MACL_00003732 [Theileria orientalis]BAM38924.1 conserved hypothetical protein [Theileria orientalis strain Shintoku]|eukprot:XP_009689225.1 conserved hypothetical protein [Theileria orientalis strain Shintoku]